MSIWNAILLGIVQGVSEFMPVSGSGHLAVLQHLFGVTTNGDYYFLHALLHAGTLIAIIFVYRSELNNMRQQLMLNRMQQYQQTEQKQYPKVRLFAMIAFASIPMIIAAMFYSMFSSLAVKSAFVSVMLLLNGILIYATDQMKEGKYSEGTLPFRRAILVGLCQCAAIVPGISRVAAAYGASTACGLRRERSLHFTYMLSIPALIGIVIVDLAMGISRGISLGEVPGALFAMVCAIVFGILSLRLMKQIVESEQYGNFAYYCWVIGVVTLLLTFIF